MIKIILLFFAFACTFAPSEIISTELQQYTIAYLKEEKQKTIELVVEMLTDLEYKLLTEPVITEYKPALIIIIAETNKGKKFLKLHNSPEGKNEFNGAHLLKQVLPVITPECLITKYGIELLVQPFIDEINSAGGMLYDRIWEASQNQDKELFKMLDDLFAKNLKIVTNTISYYKNITRNDRLYFDRLKDRKSDRQSGRIETFYKDANMNIAGAVISWENLLDKKWIVDGVEYQETLREFLLNAKNILNPNNQRFIATCHGDWHDMNIGIQNQNGLSSYIFLDCELSGCNCVFGDAMVYLIYNSIQGDYLTPKYFSWQFKKRQQSLISAKKYFPLKERKIDSSVADNYVTLTGVYKFGTSPIRKKIAFEFIQCYFKPLMKICKGLKNNIRFEIESKIKATLLLRLIGVYNISLLEPNDQAKIFGLLFKCLGTPINKQFQNKTLFNFLNAI